MSEDGAWQCGDGHMFQYEPPPASPPWCIRTTCHAGDFRWIIKDEVTSRDWVHMSMEDRRRFSEVGGRDQFAKNKPSLGGTESCRAVSDDTVTSDVPAEPEQAKS